MRCEYLRKTNFVNKYYTDDYPTYYCDNIESAFYGDADCNCELCEYSVSNCCTDKGHKI